MNYRSAILKHQATPVASSSNFLQYKCACGNHTTSSKCDDCADRKGLLQRRFGSDIKSPEVPPIAHEVLRSPGEPLDAGTRSLLEPKLGRVFGQSRVQPISGHHRSMTDAYQRLCDAFTPGKESRAYDAGAPAYQKLVDEINARATKEKW